MLPEDILTDPQEPTFDPLPAGEGLSIGETAPAFSLPDGDGNIHSLDDYTGKVVVLAFYATGG
ncbi:redoxin domain-containing protein [Candidatus Poribacteria bacterium]|nr:redoxin domain-containing protein [Candidatus Poribacteria bacterium]